MHPPSSLARQVSLYFSAALLTFAAGVQAAEVTTVYGDHGGTLWTSTAGPTATQSTPVVGFTVGGTGGTTYSTGVNDDLLPVGTYTAAKFHALVPVDVPVPSPPSETPLRGSGSGMALPTTSLTTFLTDGPRGLELATALFNLPARNLEFAVTFDAKMQM